LEDWSTLLSILRCAYTVLDSLAPCSPRQFCSAQILLVKSILLSIPRPLGQHIPLEKVEEILYLDNKFLAFVTISPQNMKIPPALGWVEEEIFLEDDVSTSDEESKSGETDEVIMANSRSLVDEVESCADSRSSKGYGETYTESVDTETRMMGITFDYSNLFS